jgi:hypothetical protein
MVENGQRGVAAAELTPTPVNLEDARHNSYQTTSGHRSDRNSERIRRGEWWLVISTVLVAVFTAASAVIFFLQWRTADSTLEAIKGQLDEMRKSSEQVDQTIHQFRRMAEAAQGSVNISKENTRARLLVKIETTDNLNDPKRTSMTVSFTNVGTTPAYNVSRYGVLFVAKYPLEQTILPLMKTDQWKAAIARFKKEPYADNLVLQPTQRNTFKIFAPETLVNEMTRVREGGERLYVAGTIVFMDIYKEMQISGFCASYKASSIADAISHPGGNLVGEICNNFNSAGVIKFP